MAKPVIFAEQIINFEASLVIEAAAAEGKSPKFSMVAYSGGVITQQWSDVPVVVDLAGMDLPTTVPILSKHDPRLGGIGHTTSMKAAGGQLLVAGDVSRDTDTAREFVASSKRGYPWRTSIGAKVTAMMDVRDGTVTVNGQTFTAPLKVATKSQLYEISIVELPASAGTSAVVSATAHTGVTDPMKKIALSNGTTIDVAADASPEVIAQAVAAAELIITAALPVKVPATGVIDFTEQRRVQAAEVTRVGAINLIAGITPALAAQAITEGWTVDRAELLTLRASRASVGPGILVPSQPEIDADVLAAAVCQSGGLDINACFPVKACEVAQKAFRGRIGLQQLLVTAAHANGWRGDTFMRSNSDIREVLAAGFSSGSLASVLSNAANKFLLDAFNSVEETWRLIAAINADVQDFKEYNTYAFTGDLTMKPVGQGGNIASGTLEDTGYANKLGTVARMLTITRQDIINDNLGMLSGGARRLGRGGALALNLIFWKEFADNAAFFTAARKNYVDGADSVLASAGMRKMQTAFRKQVGPDGNPLGCDPKILLVPSELEVPAMELLTSTQVNTGGASTQAQVPNRNIWAGKFTLAVSSYLSNANAVGAGNDSATAHYLLADPKDLPTIEVGFLRGAVAPVIEDVQADADVLGVSLRGFFDFGVRKQVPQGGVKSKGAA